MLVVQNSEILCATDGGHRQHREQRGRDLPYGTTAFSRSDGTSYGLSYTFHIPV